MKYSPASKQLLIHRAPLVLIAHLKRFQQQSGVLRRIGTLVDFKQTLDISPFCSKNVEPKSNLVYELYAVVVHSGTLNSGHYVAYVKVRSGNEYQWFYASDSHVNPVDQNAPLSCEGAYMLFYQRKP